MIAGNALIMPDSDLSAHPSRGVGVKYRQTFLRHNATLPTSTMSTVDTNIQSITFTHYLDYYTK